MTSASITTREQLHAYLVHAMRLEHATIPPYLTALYSIRPGTNSDAFHILRVTVVEEMLHLTLAANVLNAVGGSPDLTCQGFVPDYPAYLPDGETDFQVSRQRFSEAALDTFLKIERPRKAPDAASRLQNRGRPRHNMLGVSPMQPQLQFYSIGEFYLEIWSGIRRLHAEMGDSLFSGDAARQVTPEYFYSGGGTVVPVTDLASAKAAIDLIAEQGEGFGGGIYDTEHELAHYYRFEQLKLGRYYQGDDEPGSPTGPPTDVDWDSAFPVKIDAKLADYPPDSELHEAAVSFNTSYAHFLELLTRAYTGQPALLHDAVVEMFRIRDQMTRLIHNPIPGSPGLNAAPTFEVATVPAAVTP
ncbi:MAG TPA: ferritin-like protein [Microlunatus sp.]|nr:ferritin-like protein [Microlunatus sp.]